MKRPPQVNNVEAEYNGTLHRAEYTVEHGVVTVVYGRATNSVVCGSQMPNSVAHLALIEILQGNNWKF